MDALEIECPTCGAQPGGRCVSTVGPLYFCKRLHTDRIIVARTETPEASKGDAGRWPGRARPQPEPRLSSGRRRCLAKRRDGMQCQREAHACGRCSLHREVRVAPQSGSR